jgi:hypothetical protein
VHVHGPGRPADGQGGKRLPRLEPFHRKPGRHEAHVRAVLETAGRRGPVPIKISESSAGQPGGEHRDPSPTTGKDLRGLAPVATSSNPDSILVARSWSSSARPSRRKNTTTVADVTPSTRTRPGTRFRDECAPRSPPSDGRRLSRVGAANGSEPGRADVISTSSNQGKTWNFANRSDSARARHDDAKPIANSFSRGHQLDAAAHVRPQEG